MRQQDSIRSEADARGVSYRVVQQERQGPAPEVAQRIRYYGRVLRLVPAAIAAQLEVSEAVVVRVLATDPPAVAVSEPMISPPAVAASYPPSVRLSPATDPDLSPPPRIIGPAESERWSAD